MDEPGPGGASHLYYISSGDEHPDAPPMLGRIGFHNGESREPRGVTNEVLLAIVEDRLAAFQAGPFSCRENMYALKAVRESLMWCRKRSEDRAARGVEGKLEK